MDCMRYTRVTIGPTIIYPETKMRYMRYMRYTQINKIIILFY